MKAETGKWGEREAERYLVSRQRFSIVEKNWRCPLVEIDIVARQKDVLVFVEVKTRSPEPYLSPKFTLTLNKRRRLGRLAKLYLKQNHITGQRCRFDVVALIRGSDGKVENLEYIRSAFSI